jgi:hypothetical protein
MRGRLISVIVAVLTEVNSPSAMLSGFLVPLQEGEAIPSRHSVAQEAVSPALLLVVILGGRLFLHLHRFLLISFVEDGFLGAQPETSGNVWRIPEQIIAQSY